MRLNLNHNIWKTSHPFSALMGTMTGVILSFKFSNSESVVIKLGIIFFLAQFLTGIVNDYVDFESDAIYQPLKISSRGKIEKEEISTYIKINIALLLIISPILMSLDIVLIIIFGVVMSQSYNLKFKDTPLSGFIFVSSFGLMAVIPYVLEYGYTLSNLPIRFIITGLILAVIAHIINDLVDYEIDILRQSKSMTVTLGRPISINSIIVLLFILFLILGFQIILMIFILIVVLVLKAGIKHSSYRIREFVYYTVAILSLLVLYNAPVN